MIIQIKKQMQIFPSMQEHKLTDVLILFGEFGESHTNYDKHLQQVLSKDGIKYTLVEIDHDQRGDVIEPIFFPCIVRGLPDMSAHTTIEYLYKITPKLSPTLLYLLDINVDVEYLYCFTRQ